jgi:hypothetical protein
MRSSSTHDVFRENWKVIEQNLDASSGSISAAKQHNTGIFGLETILNVNQFLSILNYDLSIVHYELLSLEAGWRRSFHARVAALLIVEFMEDIGQLVGMEWRAAILPLVTADESQKRFQQICKTSLQLKAICGMDSDLICEIVLDVTKWATGMMASKLIY